MADEITDCTIEIRTKSSIKTEDKKFRFICTLKYLANIFKLCRYIAVLSGDRNEVQTNEAVHIITSKNSDHSHSFPGV